MALDALTGNPVSARVINQKSCISYQFTHYADGIVDRGLVLLDTLFVAC